jgi:hypothetical protein
MSVAWSRGMKRSFGLLLLLASFLHSSLAKADDASSAARSKTEMRSPAMVLTGSVLTVLGSGAVATSVYFLAHTGQCQPSNTESWVAAPPCSFYDGGNRFFGYAALAGGAAFLAAGVPLIIVGAWRVPSKDTPGHAALRIGANANDVRLSVTF